MIVFDKFFALLKQRGHNLYWIRTNKLIGQMQLDKLRKGTGGLTTETINKLCRALECQPGDLMEYVPDESEE